MKNISVPTKDKDLLAFAIKGKKAFQADEAGFGFDASEVEDLIAAVDEYDSAYSENKAAQTAARLKKDEARRKLRKMLGGYVQRMRARNDISPARLVAFGVQPTDRTRTPINAPETAPLFTISHAPAWHIIRFWEQGSERRRRKPRGVIGAEIYVNFDGDRDDPEAYR